MAADRDLSFNVAAIDRTAKSFEKIALRLERLESKLDKLDRKRVNVDVDIDTDRALRQVDNFSQVATSATAGAVRLSTSSIYVFIGVVAAALLALPAAGALAATGIVLAFGAGLAGLGIAAAAQDKNIRKVFKDLVGDLGKDLKKAAEPFLGTLRTVAAVARNVFDSLNLEGIFAQLAPAMSRFARNLGQALQALAPALGPLTDAFTLVMDRLGPALVPLFEDIGAELSKLADVVGDNADIFTAFIVLILKSIPLAIKIVRGLAAAFAWGVRTAAKINSAVTGALVSILKFARTVALAVLDVFGAVLDGAAKAFGWVPGIGPKIKAAAAGFDTFRDRAAAAFDKAIAKAEAWKDTVDRVDKVIELTGDISDLEGKLAAAKRKLKDPTLTKAQKKEIRGNIRDLEAKLAKAKAKLDELKPPTIKRVKGRIRDLEDKLATAKKKLEDPTISRATKKKIRGDIKDLREKINKAKQKLRELKDKTVYIDVITRSRTPGGHPHTTGSSAYPRAEGGPVTRGRSYLVGERGPELFTPAASGHITPNDQLAAAFGRQSGEFTGNLYLDSGQFLGVVRGEIAEQNRTTKTRALAGTGANR